jgi:hypothetical protein
MEKASSKETDGKHVTVTTNLPASLAKLESHLQHLVDVVSIGVIGVQKVEEAEYKVSPFAAAQQLAEPLSYAEAKEEHLYWSLKSAFTEAIDRIGEFLEECRVLAVLYRLGSTTINGEGWNRIWTTEREAFDRKPFPAKIEYLREQCGTNFQFEEHVLTLNQARNCLVHRLGVVSEKDSKGKELFTIKWHSIRFVIIDCVTGEETFVPQLTPTKNESTLNLRIGPIEKSFHVGDRLRLSPEELNYTMWTFRSFALELLQAIERLRPSAATDSQGT